MDAIKKKMHAMKQEKDAIMDKAETLEMLNKEANAYRTTCTNHL